MLGILKLVGIALGHGFIIGDHTDLDALVQLGQSLQLGFPHQIVGDQDVLDPSCCHALGFSYFLTSDSTGPEFDLQICEAMELVGFDVGSQRQTVGVCITLNTQ